MITVIICIHFLIVPSDTDCDLSFKKSSNNTAVIEFIPDDVEDSVDEYNADKNNPGNPGKIDNTRPANKMLAWSIELISPRATGSHPWK